MIETFTIKGFFDFCKERESLRILKTTEDDILKRARFTNINRLYDRGTIELFEVLGKFNSFEDKILIILFYRHCSSGNKILEIISKFNTLIDFVNWFSENKIEKYGNRIPYQLSFYKKGVTFKTYFLDQLYVTKDVIINTLTSFKNETIKSATQKIAQINKVGDTRCMRFATFQAILDIAHLFESYAYIDKDSSPFYGEGSTRAIKNLSKNENLPTSDIINKIMDSPEWIWGNETVLEHALCEYYKYCYYSLGLKKIKGNNRYIPHEI